MATSSGLVLDYDTQLGVSGVTVLLLTATGTTIEASGTTNPVGYFSFTRPDTISAQTVIYHPIRSDLVGYSRTLPRYTDFVTLYTRSQVQTPNASGTATVNTISPALVTSCTVRDMISTGGHYYVITDAGLDVVDANTLMNAGYIVRSGGFTCISLNPSKSYKATVLLGTSNSGVLGFTIPETGYSVNSQDLSSLLGVKYNTIQNTVRSDSINKIHQNQLGDVVIASTSGVDFITYSGARYYTIYPSGVGNTAVQVSEFGDLYYSPTNSGLYAVKRPNYNWTVPDYTVKLSGTGANPFPLLSNYINDIAVTSVSGGYQNTVFLATPSGVMSFLEDADLNISASGAKLFRSFP